MIAGKGITHSERATKEDRAAGLKLHGIQSWIALPPEHAETEPSFPPHPTEKLPKLRFEGATLEIAAKDRVATDAGEHRVRIELERSAT